MSNGSSVRDAGMGIEPPGTETVSCTLVITRNGHSEILVIRDGPDVYLPSVDIPMWERAAPHLNSLVRKQWGVDAICLFNSQTDNIESDASAARYYVLEAIHTGPILKTGAAWVTTASIGSADARSIAGQARLQHAITQARAYDNGKLDGTFVRSGWLKELAAWMQSQLSSYGWQLTGNWVQYNMGPNFCLLRANTSGPRVWFKAVGEPNLREYAITLLLHNFAVPIYLRFWRCIPNGTAGWRSKPPATIWTRSGTFNIGRLRQVHSRRCSWNRLAAPRR